MLTVLGTLALASAANAAQGTCLLQLQAGGASARSLGTANLSRSTLDNGVLDYYEEEKGIRCGDSPGCPRNMLDMSDVSVTDPVEGGTSDFNNKEFYHNYLGWHIYKPAGLSGATCQVACDVLDDCYGFTVITMNSKPDYLYCTF